MKKTLPYLLLFLFLFNSLGYYFIFQLYKYHVKNEMKTQAYKGSSALAIIKITDAQSDKEFRRVEKKEIRYKGSLYDVVKEDRAGRTTIFYCIHDKKEETLLAAMKTLNKNKFLLSLWDHMIKIAMPHFNLALTNAFPMKVLFPHISVTLHSALIVTWSPPPELS